MVGEQSPTIMPMWTFKTSWKDTCEEWHTSGQRFDTPEQATEAMMEWVVISAHNGHMMPVVLVKVGEGQ
jgi:hypothetical protein